MLLQGENCKMKRKFLYLLYIKVLFPFLLSAQINTDQVLSIGVNALYFEDYVLSIQYFNQVINAKPYLAEPYFYRGVAKLNLDDYQGAEADCTRSIDRNPFVVNVYQVRGLSRIRQKNYEGAISDYQKAKAKFEETLKGKNPPRLFDIHEYLESNHHRFFKTVRKSVHVEKDSMVLDECRYIKLDGLQGFRLDDVITCFCYWWAYLCYRSNSY